MTAHALVIRRCVPVLLLALAAGCGTTRATDSDRAATEQLLISSAIDQSVSKLDFRALVGKKVYFDPQYLNGTVDKGYLVSSIRQHLLATGCLLQDDRAKATYVVEARAGAVGTDRNSLLIGVPQMNVPVLVPGQPSQIPEIPLAKKTDQAGVAKVAVFAYNRLTGERVWQSGTLEAKATAKDLWLFGAGPFQNGTVRDRTTFAGEPLPAIPFVNSADPTAEPVPPAISVTEASVWGEHQQAPAGGLFPALADAGPVSRPVLTALLQAQLDGAKGMQPAIVRTSAEELAPVPPRQQGRRWDILYQQPSPHTSKR